MIGYSESELIDRIREEPDNDDYRLILADYYAEHQQPYRAELIRVQLALNGLLAGDPRAEFLHNMQELALSQSTQHWTSELTKLVDGYSFHRGLPEKISITLPKLKKHGDYLFSHFPIRCVTLLSEGFNAKLLSQIPTLLSADTVQFPNSESGDEICRAISRFRGGVRVRHIDLNECRITAEGMRHLSRWDHHSQLRGLNLSYSPEINTEGIESFCLGDWQNLERLDLTGCDLDHHKMLRFTENWNGPNLRELFLSHNPLGLLGLILILKKPLLRKALIGQRVLDLRRSELNGTSMEMLCKYPELEPVEHLRLDGSYLGDVGFSMITRSPHLRNLRELDVPECNLTDRSIDHLENATFAHSLKRMDLRGNTIYRERLDELQARLLMENWRSLIHFEGGMHGYSPNMPRRTRRQTD